MNRFERQIKLKGFGPEGQKKLANAKVLVVGAGGLGCPALMYLAGAGIGKLAIADGDVVSRSNLHRQLIFGGKDVGRSKVKVAEEYLKSKYSDVNIYCYPDYLTSENAIDIIEGCDLVIDGSDNFPTRYLINDACVILDKPLILGAIYQWEGQVAVLNVRDKKGIKCNYRDIFLNPPPIDQIPNCNEMGVLGVLPGVIGTIQAAETIKLISGIGQTLVNQMLWYNVMDHRHFISRLTPNPESGNFIPKGKAEFRMTDYQISCRNSIEVEWGEALATLGENGNSSVLVDVREFNELPMFRNCTHYRIPLSSLENSVGKLSDFNPIYLFCQSGVRSLKAVEILQRHFPDKKLHSIEGGIEKKMKEEGI